MHYFSEATNILQVERKPTIIQVIPVVDSLENALDSINKDTASINMLCVSVTVAFISYKIIHESF